MFAQRAFLIQRLKEKRETVSAGINAYNAKTVQMRESLGLEQVIKEWKATCELEFQALEDLPDEKFNQQLTFP